MHLIDHARFPVEAESANAFDQLPRTTSLAEAVLLFSLYALQLSPVFREDKGLSKAGGDVDVLTLPQGPSLQRHFYRCHT